MPSYAQNGLPYRDRFQSFRQTFRVEPDPEEAQRIIDNIIADREIKEDLILLQAPDIAEDGNVVPVFLKLIAQCKTKIGQKQFIFWQWIILFRKLQNFILHLLVVRLRLLLGVE